MKVKGLSDDHGRRSDGEEIVITGRVVWQNRLGIRDFIICILEAKSGDGLELRKRHQMLKFKRINCQPPAEFLRKILVKKRSGTPKCIRQQVNWTNWIRVLKRIIESADQQERVLRFTPLMIDRKSTRLNSSHLGIS